MAMGGAWGRAGALRRRRRGERPISGASRGERPISGG